MTSTVPAGGPGDDPTAPARESYRQLLAGLDGTPVPAGRATWVAVRLDARALAEAIGDYAVDLGVAPSVVAALARQVDRSLRRSGRRAPAVGCPRVARRRWSVLWSSPGVPADATPVREEWSAWHCGPLAHRSFWIRRWPPVDRAATMLGWLETLPASLVTVSLTVASTGRGRISTCAAWSGSPGRRSCCRSCAGRPSTGYDRRAGSSSRSTANTARRCTRRRRRGVARDDRTG